MKTSLKRLSACLIAGALCFPLLAQAGVKIMGTRFIYPEQEREITVRLTNNSARPTLVQSWLDKGDPSVEPGAEKLPFMVLPPLTRIEANKGQVLRITKVANPVQDRESVYWLNVLEIPPRAEGTQDRNVMQLAFRSRLKLFYRPAGLTGSPIDAAKSLSWTPTPTGIRVRNDSAFHVSFADVTVKAAGRQFKIAAAGMVNPRSSRDYPLKGWQGATGTVSANWIDDFGATRDQSYTLKP
ncbi:fimbrial biogenesis chaperone [Aeromonas veronii]|uniref:fimbrial biogenesis chaperone n=1 Tax=Aeromonas TaxID=642 RepID=UPI0032EF76A0